MTLRPLVLLACLTFGFAASPAPAATRSVREQVDAIELDLRDLQQKVLEMQDVQASIQKSLADLRSALALDSPDRRSPADLAARLDSVETDLRVMQESQNETGHRVSILSDKVDGVYRRQAQMAEAAALAAQANADTVGIGADSAEPSEPAMPPAVDQEDVRPRPGTTSERSPMGTAPAPSSTSAEPEEPLVDPEELYQTARADYGRGSYEMALAGFEEFLQRFPESDLADNALYWVGECHYSSGRLDQAIAAFDRVLVEHPQADKAADAGYKKGLALLELNRTAEGIIQLQRVKDRWPDAPAGRLARTKLQAMGLL